jgi:hypothetical protein
MMNMTLKLVLVSGMHLGSMGRFGDGKVVPRSSYTMLEGSTVTDTLSTRPAKHFPVGSYSCWDGPIFWHLR